MILIEGCTRTQLGGLNLGLQACILFNIIILGIFCFTGARLIWAPACELIIELSEKGKRMIMTPVFTNNE